MDWKRVIVGDAFTLPSKDFNFYRDSFLMWPFLLFAIAAITNFFRRGVDHRLGFQFLAIAIVCLLLAREKVVLIGGGLGFCWFQSSWTFAFRRDPVALWVAIITGALFVLLLIALRNYKPKVKWPEGSSIATLLLGLCSLGLTILAIRWLGR